MKEDGKVSARGVLGLPRGRQRGLPALLGLVPEAGGSGRAPPSAGGPGPGDPRGPRAVLTQPAPTSPGIPLWPRL